MNKLFVVVLLAGFGACFGGLITDLLPNLCKVEADCGVNKCCLGGRICSLKLQANFPCLLTSLHKCGCTDGLECKVTRSFTIFGRLFEFRQCKAAQVPVTSDEINADSEGHQERRKRFLLRSCNDDAECGVDRCCSSIRNKCVPLILEHLPCKTASCCRAGLECKVTYTLYNPLTGAKIYDVKQCKRASESVESQALEVTEA